MRLPSAASLYLASDDLPSTAAEVVAWMSRELGVPAPSRVDATRLNKRCRNTRLRQSGFRFRYPSFREGYRDVVREFLREQTSDG